MLVCTEELKIGRKNPSWNAVDNADDIVYADDEDDDCEETESGTESDSYLHGPCLICISVYSGHTSHTPNTHPTHR